MAWHCVDNVKPFVDPDDDYMYSRTHEAKSHCQLVVVKKIYEMPSGCICLYYRPISQIPPCACSIFHPPPCNRNVYTYVHIDVKKVVIENFIVNNGIWDMGPLPTVVSRPLVNMECVFGLIYWNWKPELIGIDQFNQFIFNSTPHFTRLNIVLYAILWKLQCDKQSHVSKHTQMPHCVFPVWGQQGSLDIKGWPLYQLLWDISSALTH